MAVTINASTSTGLVQSADTSGVIELQSNGTTVATVNTSNNVQFRSSISVGNATPTTSGAGITFPATQSASSDANTLDDYEEGTFTPSVSTGITSVTYGTRVGFYTKVGNLVYYHIYVGTNGGTLNSSNFQITGLPFAVNPVDDEAGYFSYWDKVNTLGYFPSIYLTINSTNVNFYKRDGAAVIGTNIDSSSMNIRFSGVYRAT